MEHMNAEEKMLKAIKEQEGKTDNEALKLLLRHFAEDEEKHHSAPKTISSKILKTQL